MDLLSKPAEPTGLQLSLDLGGDTPDERKPKDDAKHTVVKTMLFPRHIQLPHFGQIERQLKAAFAPFGIDIEFRFTRQNRLEMKWIFAAELAQNSDIRDNSLAAIAQLTQFACPSAALTEDELSAFDNMMIDFADG